MNLSIANANSFICSQLDCSKFCYFTVAIQVTVCHLFVLRMFNSSIRLIMLIILFANQLFVNNKIVSSINISNSIYPVFLSNIKNVHTAVLFQIIIIIIMDKHERGLIAATRKYTDNTIDNRMIITRKQKWEGKQLYGRFKRLIKISHDKTWTWLRKVNFKRETESLLIAAQNNAIRPYHITARIAKTQQNSKCRLCGDRDETINHIISECSKLVQKEYKTRHDWVGKVIRREMCKKF